MNESTKNLITPTILFKIAVLGGLPGAAGGIAAKWLFQAVNAHLTNNTILGLAFALGGRVGGIFGCSAWVIETRRKIRE